MKIKYPESCVTRGDMINITTLQDPLYPLEHASLLHICCKPACLASVALVPISMLLPSLFPQIHTVFFSPFQQLHPPKLSLFLSSSISNRYTLSPWDTISLLWAHILSLDTLHLLIYSKMLHLTSGKYVGRFNYQLLPCIIVFCIPVLSSFIRSYTYLECKGCGIFGHVVHNTCQVDEQVCLWHDGVAHAEGEACKQHVIQLSNKCLI